MIVVSSSWGFFGHRKINQLAVFCLPPEMIGFYKANVEYITEASTNPDRRRLAVAGEAPRHYIDLDHFGDSAHATMPRFWKQAVERYTEDTLQAYGIVPWHINTMYYRLKEAFLVGDPEAILRQSAELGHYVADAHVPLHTTANYNGQLTGQEGIHGFWESRVPELFFHHYDFFVGKAQYIKVPQLAAWDAVAETHQKVDSVLTIEKRLSVKFEERKYSFETRGKQLTKTFSREYSKEYHTQLQGMVERQMRASVKMIADLWYTAWVDGGQPDLKLLIYYKPSEEVLNRRREEVATWKQRTTKARPHEDDHTD